jgi:hypothetical protein
MPDTLVEAVQRRRTPSGGGGPTRRRAERARGGHPAMRLGPTDLREIDAEAPSGAAHDVGPTTTIGGRVTDRRSEDPAGRTTAPGAGATPILARVEGRFGTDDPRGRCRPTLRSAASVASTGRSSTHPGASSPHRSSREASAAAGSPSRTRPGWAGSAAAQVNPCVGVSRIRLARGERQADAPPSPMARQLAAELSSGCCRSWADGTLVRSCHPRSRFAGSRHSRRCRTPPARSGGGTAACCGPHLRPRRASRSR